MDEGRKIVYTYEKAWNVEKRVYGFGNLKLPFSLALDSLGYIVLGLLIAMMLSKIPVFGANPLITYGGLMVGIPVLMKKAKIHSKTPARFVTDYFLFLITPKSLVRFHPVTEKGSIKFTNVHHSKITENA